MATKTVSWTTESTISVCDECNKACVHLDRCNLCRKEVGYCCGKLVLAYDNATAQAEGPYIDLCFRVCKSCEAAGEDVCGSPYITLIRQEVEFAEGKIAGLLRRWREWAEERSKRTS